VHIFCRAAHTERSFLPYLSEAYLWESVFE